MLIGLDWGTSNCRAFLIGRNGAIAASRAAPRGILSVQNGDFAAALTDLVGDWLDAHPDAPALLSGMVGSRQGWIEAPYVALPAGADEIAARLAPLAFPRPVAIVPGVVGPALAGGCDVMRGEETQIIGALDLLGVGDGVLCLPGTHSKWAEVVGGRIVRFATFMTGEVYGVLRAHSILGRLMQDDAPNAEAFAVGLARAEGPGGLLHQLFGARTEGLFGDIPPAALGSFLSGLLIGHEVASARAAMAAARVILVGAADLSMRYAAALGAGGVETVKVAGDGAAARGLWRIAQRAGTAASSLRGPGKPG